MELQYTANDIIIDGMVQYLIESLGKYDELVPERIRGGRLQDDPTEGTGLSVLVEYDTRGQRLTNDENTVGQKKWPPYFIGGGVLFRTSYQLNLRFHFKTNDRADARRKSNILLNRIRYALLNMPLPTHPVTRRLVDDLGESILDKELVGFEMKEAGGPGQYIWYGSVDIDFITMATYNY